MGEWYRNRATNERRYFETPQHSIGSDWHRENPASSYQTASNPADDAALDRRAAQFGASLGGLIFGRQPRARRGLIAGAIIGGGWGGITHAAFEHIIILAACWAVAICLFGLISGAKF